MLAHALPAVAGPRNSPQPGLRFAADRPGRPANLPLALVVAGHLGVLLLLMSQPGQQMMHASSAIFVTLLQEQPSAETRRSTPPPPQPLARNATTFEPLPPDLATLPVVMSGTEPSASGSAAGNALPSSDAAASAPSSASAPAPSATAPRFDAAYLNNPAPVYPPLSRRMGEEGRVLLRVQVDAAGNAIALEIRDSSGSHRLDNAALEAVRRWKFVAAKLGEQNVAAWVLVPVNFSLRNSG